MLLVVFFDLVVCDSISICWLAMLTIAFLDLFASKKNTIRDTLIVVVF